MYEPKETDVSGRNYQEEMKDMLRTMIPVYENFYSGKEDGADEPVNLGPSLIKEMNDMLEFSGATVTGVSDRAQAIVDYLMHHYDGAPKPDWYAALTGA